jgi:phosphopantothenoylcysteine decarboxylase/phosphopantothenate--cysteine ligase
MPNRNFAKVQLVEGKAVSGRLENYEILLGVSGGIAAYKSAALCSLLVREEAAVTVAMTEHAGHFVGPLTFGALSGRKVYDDLFASEQIYETEHINLTERADLIVVAPATANIIAKMAAGICDDLLSTILCSAESDILLAPAMNERMWLNKATCRNIQTLKDWGCHIIGPESGRLACGTEGVGRMTEPEAILERVVEILAGKNPKKV